MENNTDNSDLDEDSFNQSLDEETNLSNLVIDMNKVSLNKVDIYSVILELFDDYTDDESVHQSFDKFWSHPHFISLISEQGQMSIVSGIQSVTLSEHIPFSRLIDYYFNDHLLEKKLTSISLFHQDRKMITDFIFYFRKELFSNVFYSNLKLQKLTLIEQKTLDERLENFIKKNTRQ